jgi:hypothetical protein
MIKIIFLSSNTLSSLAWKVAKFPLILIITTSSILRKGKRQEELSLGICLPKDASLYGSNILLEPIFLLLVILEIKIIMFQYSLRMFLYFPAKGFGDL